MIKILKVKPCDIEWAGKKTSEEYITELVSKYGSVFSGERKIDDLSNVEFADFTRLQASQFMSMDDISQDYMTIYLDEDAHMFLISFNALEERMKSVEMELAKEDGVEYEELPVHYFPIYKLLLNQDLRDPFVHYDAKRNLFSVPSKVLVTNEAFVKELQLDLSNTKFKMNELEGIAEYDEEEKVWVYSLDNVDINTPENEEFRNHWNYASSQDVNDTNEELIAYDADGKECGRVFEISVVSKKDMMFVYTEDGSQVVEEGENFDFSTVFGTEINDDMMFIYITEPTDGFAFSVMTKNGQYKIQGTSVVFGDYNNIIDKYVYVKDTDTLYIPVRVMNFSAISVLHKLGFSWRAEDLESIGCSAFSPLSDETIHKLVDEAMVEANEKGLEAALRGLIQKIAALKNVDDSMINYDEYVKDLLHLFEEKRKEEGIFTEEEAAIMDSFKASDFGTLPDISSTSEKESTDDDLEEDEIVFD
jgi:hypothetical protein